MLAAVQYGFASLLSLNGSFTHRKVSYSLDSYAINGLSQDAVSAGINYRPSAALTLGAALRHTRAEYADNVSGFNRNDLDLTANWQPRGRSSASGRLSYGRQTTNGALTGNDFSGVTGFAAWSFQATGKLTFTTSLSRETGAEAGFLNFNGQQIRGIGDTSRLTNALALDVAYAVSGKVNASANLSASRRSLTSGVLTGDDTSYRLGLGANWTPRRNLLLGCNIGRETRSASGSLSAAYNATTALCSAQFTIQ